MVSWRHSMIKLPISRKLGKLFTRKLSTIVTHHFLRNSVSGKMSFKHFYNLLTIASSCKSQSRNNSSNSHQLLGNCCHRLWKYLHQCVAMVFLEWVLPSKVLFIVYSYRCCIYHTVLFFLYITTHSRPIDVSRALLIVASSPVCVKCNFSTTCNWYYLGTTIYSPLKINLLSVLN